MGMVGPEPSVDMMEAGGIYSPAWRCDSAEEWMKDPGCDEGNVDIKDGYTRCLWKTAKGNDGEPNIIVWPPR